MLQTHCRPGNLPPCPVPVDAPSDRCGDAIMTAVGGGVFIYFIFILVTFISHMPGQSRQILCKSWPIVDGIMVKFHEIASRLGSCTRSSCRSLSLSRVGLSAEPCMAMGTHFTTLNRKRNRFSWYGCRLPPYPYRMVVLQVIRPF